MKKLNCSLFLICSVVFGLATSSAAAIVDGCDATIPDSVDILSLTAVSVGEGTDQITVIPQ